MATLTGKIIADFTTSLASALAVGATSATLQSATDDDGVSLPAGRYYFTLDGSNSSKEHISCTLSGTALTSIKSVSRQGVETSGTARAHRLGATVTITDFAHIFQINNLINGTTDLDASDPLKYDGVATLTPGSNQLATVVYADALAIAGSPDATTTQKGITKMSVAPVSAASPIAVGDNDGRVPTQGENDAQVGNNTDIAVGTGNKYVTQTGLQKAAECYAASSAGNDTYVITLSPVPTSLVNGMTLRFKADVANTGAATLNVNSLGALAIVTGVSTALATGDIVANQVCEVIYNSTGTVWQLVNPASALIVAPIYTNGEDTYDTATASGTKNIAHGLGKVPKYARLTFMSNNSVVAGGNNSATLVYNGTTKSCVGRAGANGATRDMNGTDIVLYGPTGGSNAEFATAVLTWDATNLILTITKTGSPTGVYDIVWETQS